MTFDVFFFLMGPSGFSWNFMNIQWDLMKI